jgi:Methyltransferase domain
LNNSLFDSLRENRLAWLEELGIGWYPCNAQPYDGDYWARYLAMDATPCGEQLTAMRCAMVRKHFAGAVVDIGIGGGRFVQDLPAFGYDINPAAVDWLMTNGKWIDPYQASVRAVTCWDSLEHIYDPRQLLRNVIEWAFVSIPIFKDSVSVLQSRHYRKTEHYWYFTRTGFVEFMHMQGFELIEQNCMEQAAGREDIESFAFKRAA